MTYPYQGEPDDRGEADPDFYGGGTNKTLDLDSLTVKVEQKAAAGVSLSLKTDKDTVNPGEEVTLTASISNTGNTTLTDIALSDGQGNKIQADATSLAAGASTTANVTVTPQQTGNYQYTVSAKDPEGGQVTATSNQVTVTVEKRAADRFCFRRAERCDACHCGGCGRVYPERSGLKSPSM